MGINFIGNEKECEIALNKLAREEMKLKLLADIRINFEVCQFTGENPMNYLIELKEIIDEFINRGGLKNE